MGAEAQARRRNVGLKHLCAVKCDNLALTLPSDPSRCPPLRYLRAQERKAEREAREMSDAVSSKSKRARPSSPSPASPSPASPSTLPAARAGPNMTFVPIRALARSDRAPTTAAASKKASTQHRQRPTGATAAAAAAAAAPKERRKFVESAPPRSSSVASDETDEQSSPVLPVRGKRAADREHEEDGELELAAMRPSKMQRGRSLEDDENDDDDDDERSSKESSDEPEEEEVEETPDSTLFPRQAASSGREPSEE